MTGRLEGKVTLVTGVVRVAPVDEESDDGWQTTMAVNATGVVYGMRAAIPALRRAGGGSIINIASIYGPVGAPGYIAYTASKGAVIAMTKVAAPNRRRSPQPSPSSPPTTPSTSPAPS